MRKKVLLMGKSGSGKSSMRSIVFSNYIAKDTRRLGATIDVEHSHIRFLGNLVLNLWDCGGQHAFVETYLASQRDQVFKNVEVLVYVFDIESMQPEVDLETFDNCVQAIKQNSPQARLFCLIHKMDLVQEELRESVFCQRRDVLAAHTIGMQTTCIATSIWDETLYCAWSSIVHSLIPNISTLESHLATSLTQIGASELALFEKQTFLIISHVSDDEIQISADPHRFEKISNIVKQFKLSCSKIQTKFISFQLVSNVFNAFIVPYTSDTYVMVIMSDQSIFPATVLHNIDAAREEFLRVSATE